MDRSAPPAHLFRVALRLGALVCCYCATLPGTPVLAGQSPTPLGAPRLADLPEAAEGLSMRGVRFLTGYVSPFRGAAPGLANASAGTGNQSYQGEIGWWTGSGHALQLGIEVNDDPTWGPVRGRRREKSLVTPALALQGRLGAGAGVQIGYRVTAQVVWQGSAPGLFNAGTERNQRSFGAFALEVPLTRTAHGGRTAVTLVPSVATLPGTLMGAPYYGTTLRLGLAARHDLGPRWSLRAAFDAPLGPGDNVVDRDGRFRRTAAWWAALEWRATARVALDATLTNAAGVTPVTRHLTLPGDPRVLYGVGIRYTPTPPEPAPRAGAPTGLLPPGRGRIESVADTRGGWAVHAAQALGRRFQIELLATRLRGADAPALLDADLGSSWEYRIAGSLGIADQADGDVLTWTNRVSVGRDADDQQGYLIAEVHAERRLGERWSLALNPLVVHSGGRSPAGVGASVAVDTGPVTLVAGGRAALTGERPVWDLEAEAPLALAGRRGLVGRLAVTNASGPRGVGRVLADPEGFRLRLGLALHY